MFVFSMGWGLCFGVVGSFDGLRVGGFNVIVAGFERKVLGLG